MTNYYLYLDESGQFKNNGQQSMVGGYLMKGKISEHAAAQMLDAVKASDEAFAGVSTHPFHAMVDAQNHVPGIPRYITVLLQKLSADRHARLVAFEKQPDHFIVDSDKTYLDVFASGVHALLQTLLREMQRDMAPFQLHILYAHRRDVTFSENQRVDTSIWSEEYRQRIEERIGLLLAKLPRVDRKRIQSVELKTAGGDEHSCLMLADAVCFALCGGKDNFSPLQSGILASLPTLSYSVPEKATWEMLQDCFVQNRMADAILLWCGLYGKDLGCRKREFHRTLVHYFEGADSRERAITGSIISAYFQQLLSMRRYDAANELFDALMRDFFPLMEQNGIALDSMKFDLHFYRLTTATHQGNTQASAQEMEVCRALLKHLPKTFETLDYYLDYKLREIEHWKNVYAFDRAVQELKQHRECMENLLNVLGDVGDLGDYGADVKSNTLGKIYGSLLQTWTFLGLRDAAALENARKAFDLAMAQFTDARDQQRECQYRVATEIAAGRYDDAFGCLCRAAGLEENATPEEVLAAILAMRGSNNRLFALLHYAHLMDDALRSSHALGRQLYDAWQQASGAVSELFPTDTDDKDKYPRSIILWHFGAACAQIGDRSAKNYYERAIAASLPARTDGYATCLPNVATALAMELDRIALLTDDRARYAKALAKHLTVFLDIAPQSMRQWFEDFRTIDLHAVKELANEREKLLTIVRRTPVL